jgi:hypothetical protein
MQHSWPWQIHITQGQAVTFLEGVIVANREHLLIAMLPPFGPKARWMATTGVLKIARGSELRIERSTVTFLDEHGEELAELEDAFGLRQGSRLAGPCYALQRDERRRPEFATSMFWTLNHWRSPVVATFDSEADSPRPSLWCLPLHVPVPQDRQLFVQFVNASARSVNLVEAIRTATLWVEGVGHRSLRGWHWDGPGTVQPGGWTRQGFKMGDFDGAPLLGDHDVCLELFGRCTSTRRVQLLGEPWQPPALASG